MAKKDTKPPALTQQELAAKIAEDAGLLPDELLKLLDAIAKVESKRTIYRQKAEKKRFATKSKMTLPEAVELTRQRLKEREEREELRRLSRKSKKLKYFEAESRDVIEDGEYPRRLSPCDIGLAIDSAKARLLEEEEKKQQKETTNYRALLVLQVLNRMKVTEAARVAKKVALRQKRLGLQSEEEAAKLLRMAAEAAAMNIDPDSSPNEEEIVYDHSLDGFGKHLNTLIDDAAEVVKDDYAAAADVVKQWVGNVRAEE